MKRKKIALSAGGFSGEHQVSLASARNIALNLDSESYDVYTIVTEQDQW